METLTSSLACNASSQFTCLIGTSMRFRVCLGLIPDGTAHLDSASITAAYAHVMQMRWSAV